MTLGRRAAALGALTLLVAVSGVSLRAAPTDDASVPAPGYELPADAVTSRSVWLGDLTWPEVAQRIDEGTNTVIVPTGGTEQNGPHMSLGKHNRIVAEVAERVAQARGNTLVAPVLAYVPEGDPDRGTGHTRFPGTISVDPATFRALLTDTAESLRAAGFTTIAFLGDSAWNQDPQDEVAQALSDQWSDEAVTVLNLRQAYDPEANGEHGLLRELGMSEEAIGTHAGPRDTAELLAVHPEGVREALVARDGGGEPIDTGVSGDPTRATAELGEALLTLKVETAIGLLTPTSNP